MGSDAGYALLGERARRAGTVAKHLSLSETRAILWQRRCEIATKWARRWKALAHKQFKRRKLVDRWSKRYLDMSLQIGHHRWVAKTAQDALRQLKEEPVDMLLFCPVCAAQHVDAVDLDTDWLNPPHRSHLCHACGAVWRPADVPTNGVASLETRGSADTHGAAGELLLAGEASTTLSSCDGPTAQLAARCLDDFAFWADEVMSVGDGEYDRGTIAMLVRLLDRVAVSRGAPEEP